MSTRLAKATTITAFGLFTMSVAASATATLGNASQPSVRFDATGPAGLKISGTSSTLSVSEDASNVKVTAPLSTLTTGISLRDRHMREKYLETSKYPDAILVVARSALRFPAGAPSRGEADGTMTIHGVTKPVRFQYEARPAAEGIDVQGTARVNMNDFGIAVPSYLGIAVKPDVELTVKFRAKDS